jgi:hypothetical protein
MISRPSFAAHQHYQRLPFLLRRAPRRASMLLSTIAMQDEYDLDGTEDSTGRNDRLAALREPSLRAALLALGVGAIWAALSRWRRSRPSDVW